MVRRSSSRIGPRRANQALLILVPLAVVTGLVSNTIGVASWPAPAAIHGVVALAVVVVTPWKAPTVQRGLGRRTSGRITSLALLVLITIALATGLVHSSGLTDRLGPFTTMQVHIGSALGALVLVAVHARARPVPVRTTDLDRRAFLGTAVLGVAGLASWVSWEGVLWLVGSRGADRRFTGSHERGSFEPSAMPVTSWFDDAVPRIGAADWSLDVDGRLLTYEELREMPHDDVTAILDCTSGWYSEQRWRGVRLDRLLQTDARSFAVRSVTGYGRRFPARDLKRIWLVTEVGGRPLSAGHGFPARLVAPGRRGFWWVKWVAAVEPSGVPAWLQLPFPAT